MGDYYRSAGIHSPCYSGPRRGLHQASRLPTPEASRSSYDMLEDEEEDALDATSHRERMTFDDERKAGWTAIRRDSRNVSPAKSPATRQSDSRRPILPPLRTLLQNSMNSPPQSPDGKSVSIQPSPCEPSFTTDTFKPPALYPNKKLRADFVFEPVAPITAPREVTFSGLQRTDTFDMSVRSPAHYSRISSRQLSIPPCGADMSRRRESLGSYRVAIPQDRNRIDVLRSVQSSSDQHHDLGHSSLSKPPYRDEEIRRGTSSPFASVNGQLPYRRSPTTVEHQYGPHRYTPISTYDDELPQRYDISYNTSQPEFAALPRGRPTGFQRGMHRPQEAFIAPYHGPHPGHFTANHYDYQQGKSRKRSNLPKQSTEIMKTWFDQNIANPYPSEEQKAMFSSATGISMTQVSNWFINHRRRCPELRGKREKSCAET